MKRIILINVLFLICSTQLVAQLKWINPSPMPYTTHSIFFLDSLYGWAVGDHSSIIKTTDGGQTWNEKKAPIRSTLRKIYFSDRQNGVIVGGGLMSPSFGSILVTTDGGDTWTDTNPVPYPNDTRGINDMHFLDETLGYVAGFMGIYKTYDMGQTWISKGGSGWATTVYFADSLTGWVGNTVGGILKTTNGGNSWEQISNMHWTWHKDIKFLDSQTGWVVSSGLYSNYGIIRKTTDGGMSWAIQDSQLNTSYNAIELFDEMNAIVVGEGGQVLETTNGGINWVFYGNLDGSLYDITVQGNLIWLSGGKNGYPRIYTKEKSKQNWDLRSSVMTGHTFNDISFSDSLKGWVVGMNGALYYSSDKGDTWAVKNLFTGNLYSVSTPTAQDIFLGGSNGEIIRSTDAGQSWQYRTVSTGLSELDLTFFSGTYGYCFARWDNRLYKTFDGGNTWWNNFSEDFIITHSFFIDSLNGYIVHLSMHPDKYHLFATSDAGANWTYIHEFDFLGDLYFLNSRIGWIANYANILKTTDYGFTWEVISTSVFSFPTKILFKDETEGYMLAESDHDIVGLYRTLDGGESWETVRRYTFLKNIYLDKNNVLWGVGEYGQITKLETIVTSIEIPINNNDHPNKFELSQNYPNPFNPSTKISWQLPVGSWQTLKVYDVLGREVATLVDEYRNAGSYEVEFHSAGLASGVYYYQLKAGSYVQTKKMILLR